MKNKFNIPIHIDNYNIIDGDYIDQLNKYDKFIKRRIISNIPNFVIVFGIKISIIYK